MTDKSDKYVVTIDWKGGSYTGEVSDEMPHGRGEFVGAVEIVYAEGRIGSDIQIEDSDFDEYLGQIRLTYEYSEDLYPYHWPECARYVGEFNNGQLEGEGTLTIVDGSTYVGQFKAGKWHGEGSWTHPDGHECSGQWKAGLMHGQGRWVDRDGSQYNGEWWNGLRHGQGTYIDELGGEEFGNRYDGEWKDDWWSGHGVITYPSAVYEGKVEGPYPNGRGTMTYEDGTTLTGEWVEGEFLDVSVDPEDQESTSSANSPFNNAQLWAEKYEEFQAPDLAKIATLVAGDHIKVSDSAVSERFWLTVEENQGGRLTGRVASEWVELDYEEDEEISVAYEAVYDYIRKECLDAFPPLFESDERLVLDAAGVNSPDNALVSERVNHVLRLREKLTAIYPEDVDAHVQAAGGWTDLGVDGSERSLLAPSPGETPTSNLEGASIQVQHHQTAEQFWIKVVKADFKKGAVFGLVKNDMEHLGLPRWQPVQCHLFHIWDVVMPLKKESLNLEGRGNYVGGLVDHQPSGEGVCDYEDGDRYEGEFEKGVPHGFGKIIYSDGTQYIGDWNEGEWQGRGTKFVDDPEEGEWTASGDFTGAKVPGQVIDIDPIGTIYEGEVSSNGHHGNGKLTFLNGSVYVGQFMNNAVHGEGTWTYPDGSVYVGGWKDDDYHGQGSLTRPGGFNYVGQFVDGHRSGQGTATYIAGNKFVGEWKDALPLNGELFNTTGVKIATYLEGVKSPINNDSETIRKWTALVNEAVEETDRLQAVLAEKFLTNDTDKWYANQHLGSIVFRMPNDSDIAAKCQWVGSASGAKNDWLWGWANVTTLDEAKDQLHIVREHGEKEGFDQLTASELIEDDEIDRFAGQMACVANHLLKGKGIYRIPVEHLDASSYVVLTEIYKVDELGPEDETEYGKDGEIEYQWGITLTGDSDHEWAIDWFRRSAELGHEEAKYQLACSYLFSRGVEEDTEEGIRRLHTLVDRGNANAQLMLGTIYGGWRGVDENYEEAEKLIRAAADQGNSVAKLDLAGIYGRGDGVEQDSEKAVYWARQAAEEGLPRAQYMMGQSLMHGMGIEKNEAEAVKWFRTAAEADDEDAQYELGNCLRAGTGVDKNAEEAFDWMTRAANAGNEEAQDAVTEMYSDGEGTDFDLEEAVRWHRRLAKAGNEWHQYMLAESYWNGWGAEENNEKAAKWYRAAAEQEMPFAFVCLGMCYELGFGVDQDKEEAFLNYQKGYEIGIDDRAVSALARCYRSGSGVEQNIEEAKKMYLEAAESGDSDAKKHLGALYRYPEGREGFEPDMQEAMKWYRAGAEDGDSIAQSILGDFYWNGEFVDQDDQEAAKWYRASAEQEFSYGLYELGRCYDLGRGVEADKEKAFKLYMKALELDDDLAYLVAEPLAEMYLQGTGVEKNYDEAQKLYYLSGESETLLVDWMIRTEPLADVMDWIQSGISKGNAESMAAMACCFYHGDGVEENEETAITWAVKATNLGSEAGLDILGAIINYLDEMGEEVSSPEKLTELEPCLTHLAESGSFVAAKSLGKVYSNDWLGEENPELAFKWFQTAVEELDCDDLEIKGRLGTCYMDGYGVDKNPEEGFKWLLEAESELEVAQCYLDGKGVEQSYDEARSWFFKSEQPSGLLVSWMNDTEELQDVMDWVHTGIANGDAESMVALAGCYHGGTGLEMNDQLALKWAVQGAKLESEVAESLIYDCVDDLWEENETELFDPKEINPEEVEAYLCGLAEDGNARAGFYLGKFYASKWHGKENPKLAFKWYRASTEHVNEWTWHDESLFLLGECYAVGYGVQKNSKQSFKWYLRAAEEYFVPGIRNVYECYKKGLGVEKNPEEAERWANRYRELLDEEIDEHDHPEESEED